MKNILQLLTTIVRTDGYKPSQYLQMPKDTTHISSYIESRGGEEESVFFGLQAYIKDYMTTPITHSDINFAEKVFAKYGVPFNREGWEIIVNEYNGMLPLEIEAVPEGTVMPTHNVQLQITNTDPRLFWLTSYVETALLRAIWYPSTVATKSRKMKKDIAAALYKTSDIPLDILMGPVLKFTLNDFGARGASSTETTVLGGMGHLVNFWGSDTIEGMIGAYAYYNADITDTDKPVVAGSIAASEHSTITSWGRENESQAYENMIDQFAGDGKIYACVSDSYDIYNAVENIWGDKLKVKVIESGGTLVVRPDCYDEKTEIYTENGWKLFSELKNEKVAQVDENKNITFVSPLKIIAQKYKGKMVHFTDQKGRLDLLVTPNHRMVYTNKDGKISITYAKDIKMYHNKNFIRSAIITNISKELSAHEQLLIAFQADGSYLSYQKSNNINAKGYVPYQKLRWNFNKKRKADRLIQIAKNCGYEYSVHHEPARPENYNIYINVPVEAHISKNFDWVNVTTRSGDWCKSFIEEISYWDATRRSDNRFKFDTTNENVANVVYDVAILSGYGCMHSIHKDSRSDKFSDVHTLHIIKNNIIGGQSVNKKEIDYDGMVYCVTVPSGMLLVRRNKKSIISGNSGNPVTVPVEILDILAKQFGYTVNSKGYKVLAQREDGSQIVKVIQGDGLNEKTLSELLENVIKAGYSVENIALGMGGGMLQKVDRDTLKYAMKASARKDVNGKWHDIFKDPITDKGKLSKKGRLGLIYNCGLGNCGYHTVPKEIADEKGNILRPIFRNGELLIEDDFETIRDRAKLQEDDYIISSNDRY
jgi:nicotinic acid phosphoribosyltransferase